MVILANGARRIKEKTSKNQNTWDESLCSTVFAPHWILNRFLKHHNFQGIECRTKNMSQRLEVKSLLDSSPRIIYLAPCHSYIASIQKKYTPYTDTHSNLTDRIFESRIRRGKYANPNPTSVLNGNDFEYQHQKKGGSKAIQKWKMKKEELVRGRFHSNLGVLEFSRHTTYLEWSSWKG